MSVRSSVLMLLVSAALLGCQQRESDVTATAPDPAPAAGTAQAPPPQTTTLAEGFSTPESVLYDAEQDVYFVSNINGSPVEHDDNGYISRINAETLQVEPKWIESGRNDVHLGAPKGLAIVGAELWVTDVNAVAKFDRRTGAPRGRVTIEGSTFVNDLAADGETVYASDSGLKLEGGNFAPTNTDAVWNVSGRTPKRLVRGGDLNRPNGLAVKDGKLWAVTFGAAELFEIADGKKGAVTTLPTGTLDGLLALDDGSFLIASWDGKAVYRGRPGGQFQSIIQNVESPADIGFDPKRRRVLIPHFMENKVTIHPLP